MIRKGKMMLYSGSKIMKLRKVYILVMLLICSCFVLAACGKDKKPKENLTGGPKTGEDKREDDSGQEDTQAVEEDKSADTSDAGDDKGSIKRSNARARRAYEGFFADDLLAVSDIDVEGMFRKGNRYSFSEIIDTYIKNESQYFGPDDEPIRLKDATYAYIDCGADGSVELAVNLTFSLYDEYNLVCFFKYSDDEVHIIGKDDWGYRSFLTVNEYGYVNCGGSGGANLYINEYYYFDANGERVFLYSEEQIMGMDSPRIQKFYLKGGFERDDYPDDSFEVGGYTVYTVNFKEYEYDEDMTGNDIYEAFYKDQIYCFTDEKDVSVKADSNLIGFYKKEGVKWCSRDELDELIVRHQDSLGADEKIRSGKEAEWESIVDLGIMKHEVKKDDAEAGEDASDVTYYVIKDDHKKPYLNPDNPYKDHEYRPVTLKQISCKENDITDTDEWFARAGKAESGTYFSDDNYYYELTGDAGYGTMTRIIVSDKSTGKQLYDFDFSDFLYEKGYEGNDYVSRGIRNCFITDDLLYLNISHRTYSESCPVNAFMMCVNINSGEVMWISGPLISNSNDFGRFGDNMITGYGFTDEDDFVYILNRYTGQITEKIKVKKSPDYFAFVNNDLWVRTYSYDYEFDIIEK